MFNKTKKSEIKIGMLEISPQNKTILEYYFSTSGKALFKKTNQENASAFIIDFDFPGAKESWNDISKATQKPAIILSIKEVDLPSTVWIAKPLTAIALTNAAATIREMINAKVEMVSEVTTKVPLEVISGAKSDNPVITIDDKDEEKLQLDSVLEEIEDWNNNKEADVAAANNLVLEDSVQPLEAPEEKVGNESIKEETASNKVKELANITTSSELDEIINTVNFKDSINLEINSDLDVKPEIEAKSVSKPQTALEKETLSKPAQTPQEIEREIIDTPDITDSISDTPSLTMGPSDEEDIDALLHSLISGEGSKNSSEKNKASETPLSVNYARKFDEETSLSVKESDDLDLSLVESPIDESTLLKNEDVRADALSDIEPDLLDLTFANESMETEINLSEIHEAEKTNNQVVALDKQQEFLLNEIDKVEINTVPVSEHKYDRVGFEMDKNLSPKESSFTTAETELQSLLNEIREEADKDIESPQNPPQKTNKAQEIDQTDAEKRWAQLCGENDNIKKQDIKKLSYSSDEHMLLKLIQQIASTKKLQTIVRMKYNDIAIVIDRTVDTIYCNHSIRSEEYAEYCYESLDPNRIKVFELDESEIRSYRTKMESSPNMAHSIESFIWTTSLLTSRGRLLTKTDINRTVSLKTWPDLTRLEQMPYTMQIAAVLSKIPASLEEIAAQLQIPQRYVFAFYNGALALDMIEFDPKKFRTSTFSLNDLSKKGKNRGFFGRLLKRLTK
ncbi:MAG: hypothetical protein V3U71_09775 [Cocleimonas sp.]